MRHDCPECQRLWREYGAATAEHIKLDSKVRLAVLERNYESADLLIIETEKAGESRMLLRAVIREHEAVAHGKTAENANGTGAG